MIGVDVLEHDAALERIAALEAELDKHKDALVAVDMAHKEGLRKLASSQARIKELRDLFSVCFAFLEKDGHFGQWEVKFKEALSTTDDTSALDKLEAGYQARIGELLEALQELYYACKCDGSWENCGVMDDAKATLSTPTNDEALRKYVAGEMVKMVGSVQDIAEMWSYPGRYEKGEV